VIRFSLGIWFYTPYKTKKMLFVLCYKVEVQIPKLIRFLSLKTKEPNFFDYQ